MRNLFYGLMFLSLPLQAKDFLVDVPVVCTENVKDVSRAVASFGEKTFIKGLSGRILDDGTSYVNSIVMFVNPDTMSWTLVEVTKEGVYCILAAGEKLEPAK